MDTAFLLDWANLLLRWAHVITAVAWIGASFYFVFLDNSLTPPTDPALKAKGVDGELWAVHGGGFYHPQKYLVAPPALPDKLHWFYWESYSTWLTGFGLFTVLYLVQARTFLIDPAVHAWGSPWAASGAALGFLAGFWLIYDGLCRWLGLAPEKQRVIGVLVAVVVAVATWGACQLFAGRAAFVLVGAMMASAMTANVAHWIIPGQRRVIRQMKAGEPVDPTVGQRGKQRSVHNTYFTLPVLAAMLSNHTSWLTQGPRNWAALLVLMAAGALIRQFFVARHKAHVQGVQPPWGFLATGVALIAALAVAMAPAPSPAPSFTQAEAPVPTLAQVQAVVQQRCVLCHNAQVQNKGVALHTAELLRQHGQAAYQQVVVLRQMPMNNATQITDEERALIGRWVQAGMP